MPEKQHTYKIGNLGMRKKQGSKMVYRVCVDKRQHGYVVWG